MALPSSRKVAVIAVHHVHADGHIYTGGAEKYIHSVIEALLDAGVAVHVGYSGTDIYESLHRGSDAKLSIDRVDWLDENLSGDGKADRATISGRQDWLAASGADTAFFVQQASGAAFHAGILAAKSLGLRVVSTIRQSPAPLPLSEGIFASLPFSWRRRAINRVRVAALWCDAVIFNSGRVAAEYQRVYDIPARISRVIHNGEQARSECLSMRRSTPMCIGTVGRISPAKGADLLLEAFASIAGDRPNARVVFFGDGPELAGLKQRCATLGLGDRISFPGYVEDREAVFREIDIYVQASRRESMSNSVLEAMARGIPCVVTDVGGLPELVLDSVTGCVVPPGSTALAGAIRELLNDPYTCARYGEAGVKRVAEVFGVERFRKETLRAILGPT